MDGTLVYVPISPVQFLSKVYEKLGLRFGSDQVDVAYEKAEEWFARRLSDYRLRKREAFVQYNHELLRLLGAKGDLWTLAETVQDYWENMPEEAGEELFPEVPSVLRKLRERGITLGILSNRFSPVSLKSLQKHHIAEHFQHIISPQMAGAPKGKNGPEMWRFALQKAAAKPNQVLHVDDDYETSLLQAKKAGIRTILIDRKRKHPSATDCPIIHDLGEVLEYL